MGSEVCGYFIFLGLRGCGRLDRSLRWYCDLSLKACFRIEYHFTDYIFFDAMCYIIIMYSLGKC